MLCSLDNGSSVFNVADMKGRPVNYLDFGRVVLAESSRMCTTEHSVCMCDRNLYDAVYGSNALMASSSAFPDVFHWQHAQDPERMNWGEGREVKITVREVRSEGYRIALLSCSSQYRGFIKKTNTHIYDNFVT